jgi:2-polyprenyl-6-methoxyphenol hydroxylase-like FAD-dependent oxidoreductase
MPDEKLNIAVAGAGIAGLAAAALLARDGHRVTVFDQFDAPASVGAGLMVQPVGLVVLADLGLDHDLIARASPIRRLYGRAAQRGPVVLDVRYPAGYCGLAVQRADLFNLLHQAALAAGAVLVTSTRITRAEDRGSQTWLEAESGTIGSFDIALDCLGARSVLCPRPAPPLRYGALWALLDWPDDAGFDEFALEQRYRAASRMAGVLPVGRVEPGAALKTTFFWSLRGSDHNAWLKAPLRQWKAQVLELWPECGQLLDQISDHRQLAFARYSHRTLRRPLTGLMAHLGDSYHATSPQLGQGANMALLDAMALAVALRSAPDPIAGLERYAALRRWHVRLYQGASWLFTPVYQSDSWILPIVRDRAMAPFSRIWPIPAVLAGLVGGRIGRPLARLGLNLPRPWDG